MGSGKTIICLTLILISLDQKCQPPSDRPATTRFTAYGLGHIPFEKGRHSRINPDEPYKPKLPTLANFAANVLAKQPPLVSNDYDLTPSCAEMIDSPSFYYSLPGGIGHARRSALVAEPPYPVRVILANTTLVIVPRLLISQWISEIGKHLLPNALTVLVVGDIKTPVPELREVMQHDVSDSLASNSRAYRIRSS